MNQTLKRVLWMVGLWAASVLALAAVSSLFRLLMHSAGLTS
ncbi:DUF2474 family protein [Citrobacter sp. JGM124]|nr:DUF2474 family protein [Citrobacter sp. JGM124]MBS0847391.1 DUF2474 family protein [Citrobacter sp. JGM124]